MRRRRSLLSKLSETIAKSNRSRNDRMLESYVLDSSVLVASLIPSDKYYSSGIMVVKRLLSSNDIVYSSAIVPVEVCAAVSRRTKDKVSAREAAAQIEKWISLGRLRILYLNATRMRRAQEIGIVGLLARHGRDHSSSLRRKENSPSDL